MFHNSLIPTAKNAVVMGYKTWLSLNCKPLVGRVNVVLTQKHREDIGHDIDIIIVTSMDDAWAHLQRMPNIENVFAIGGCQVYKAALMHRDSYTVRIPM